MKEELTQLRDEVREERRLLYEHMQKQWDKPLPERVDSGRALSQLEITEIDHEKHLIHFLPPREDFAFFSDQQRLRLSQNDPTDSFFRITFLGLTNKGLSIYCSKRNGVRQRNGASSPFFATFSELFSDFPTGL